MLMKDAYFCTLFCTLLKGNTNVQKKIIKHIECVKVPKIGIYKLLENIKKYNI